jgi:hypothetical protein
MATGLSIAAIVIALIALVTSRQALAWQKRQDLARVTPSVRVEFEHAAHERSQLLWATADLEDPRPVPLRYLLTVNVVNEGLTTERIKRLRVESADHSETVDITRGSDEELQPRARFSCELDLRVDAVRGGP